MREREKKMMRSIKTKNKKQDPSLIGLLQWSKLQAQQTSCSLTLKLVTGTNAGATAKWHSREDWEVIKPSQVTVLLPPTVLVSSPPPARYLPSLSLSLCFLFTHFALARICSLSSRTNFNGINQLLFFVLEFHCFNHNHIIAAN